MIGYFKNRDFKEDSLSSLRFDEFQEYDDPSLVLTKSFNLKIKLPYDVKYDVFSLGLLTAKIILLEYLDEKKIVLKIDGMKGRINQALN